MGPKGGLSSLLRQPAVLSVKDREVPLYSFKRKVEV